jgi:hypothetical protein
MCNSHADCDAQLFCSIAATWPWAYTCAKLRTSYEQCYETNECSLAHYCWYASNDDLQGGLKKCLPLYSQDHGTYFGWYSKDWKNPTYEDFKYNGQYCKSGLAFPYDRYTARCTTTDHISFKHRQIVTPYQCDPRDNENKCQLFFNTTDYVPGKEAN